MPARICIRPIFGAEGNTLPSRRCRASWFGDDTMPSEIGWYVCAEQRCSTHRHGHVGSDEDVEAHVKLAPRHQVRVGHVALYHVGFRAILFGFFPSAVRLPFTYLAELGHYENSSEGKTRQGVEGESTREREETVSYKPSFGGGDDANSTSVTDSAAPLLRGGLETCTTYARRE